LVRIALFFLVDVIDVAFEVRSSSVGHAFAGKFRHELAAIDAGVHQFVLFSRDFRQVFLLESQVKAYAKICQRIT